MEREFGSLQQLSHFTREMDMTCIEMVREALHIVVVKIGTH